VDWKVEHLAKAGPEGAATRHRDPDHNPTWIEGTAMANGNSTRSRNGLTARQSTLKTYARPVIASRLVDQITTEDVLSTLSPIWTNRTETAKQVQGCMENILDFGMVSGRAFRAMCSRLSIPTQSGHLFLR
jgi:hypothetical protein